ncbi:MAG: ATP-binding protein [Lachnospira sp.]|nr:ATP-binding protein [Lachnospira sp.]
MSLTNTQYASIMRQYDDIRAANRHLQNERYNEVTAICPDIADIDSAIIDLSMKTARARIESDSSATNTDELSSNLKSLNNRKAAALASVGKPADYLDDIYTCPYCKDSGYVDGHRCICFKKKAIDLIYKDSNLKNITDNENFDTFSFDWYNNTDVDPATGLTPYNNMQKVLNVCHEFVDNFDSSFSNLLFIGQTGVGKTFLSNCIAKALMESCHSIIYLTAGEFFDSFKSDEYKSFGSSKFDTSFFIECDLLIIDDLGTERSSDYSFSNLFTVINERLLRRKSVIISSNLSMPDIETRYSQRVFSRIVSAYSILRIFGDDIRCMKKLSPVKKA